MNSYIGPIILGVFIIVLGVFNYRGNIGSIHWYHRRRVTEEDRIPFGREVGLGTIIIGVAMILYSALSSAAEALNAEALTVAGSAVVIAGLVIGLAMSFHAMIKYNKGIF